MKKIVIFEKNSNEPLPDNYKLYLDSFICNCILDGDCRLSNLVYDYTKDYDISKRPFSFSDFYVDYVDNNDEFFPYEVVRMDFSSEYPDITDAFIRGVKNKVFYAKEIGLPVVTTLDTISNKSEEMYLATL